MNSYLTSVYSYGCSFIWTPKQELPEKKTPPSAEVTLNHKQPVYQELFSRLVAMNSLLYRKDYKAFMERWTYLKDYETVWTPDMRKYLDPHFDGQFFNMWFNPNYTIPIQTLQGKLEGCIDVTRQLASITEEELKQMYSNLSGDLIQMEFYLNFGDYQTFQEYARSLEAYQSVWTPEMRACFDPMEDQTDRLRNAAGISSLKQNLSSCIKIVDAKSR